MLLLKETTWKMKEVIKTHWSGLLAAHTSSRTALRRVVSCYVAAQSSKPNPDSHSNPLELFAKPKQTKEKKQTNYNKKMHASHHK